MNNANQIFYFQHHSQDRCHPNSSYHPQYCLNLKLLINYWFKIFEIKIHISLANNHQLWTKSLFLHNIFVKQLPINNIENQIFLI